MARKLGTTHMAFYRGWLQGLPLRQMADEYLETGLDPRRAKSTLRWVQDELRRAALRHGHHGQARLLRLRIRDERVAATSAPAASIPTIDDFREEFDPAGFYTFDELMVRYMERYPAAGDAATRKRAALLDRQIAALNWIEGMLVTSPVPADPVEAWLDPNIARRLRSAGVATLADLLGRIRDHGYHWYGGIPQFGETRALRIVKWVATYAASLGALPDYALVKPAAATPGMKRRALVDVFPSREPVLPAPGQSEVAPRQAAIVPLEAMLLPSQAASTDWRSAPPPDPSSVCDGSRILAMDDRAAIESWLNVKASGPATFRAYRKEAERLVLWAAHERGLTFGTMRVEDCAAYRDWLCALGRVDASAWAFALPQEQWFAPRYTKRYSPAWRPFEGPLSPHSVRYALTVCRALFGWLAQVRYLGFDPWPAVANPRAVADVAPDLELTRALSREDWAHLMETIGGIEDGPRRFRARLVFRLALVTGMRLSELAGSRYDRVYARPLRNGGGTRWMLKVRGKGDKWRAVPLTADVLQLMREDLRRRSLPDDPRSLPDDTPILTRLSDAGALSESGLAQMVKWTFALAERRLLDAGDLDRARAFSRASTHWLRHTTGAFLGNSGAPPSQIQQLLGHASIATTTIYTQTGDDDLYRTVEAVLKQ